MAKQSKLVASSHLMAHFVPLKNAKQFKVYVEVRHAVELMEGKPRLLGTYSNYDEMNAAHKAASAKYQASLVPGTKNYLAREEGLRALSDAALAGLPRKRKAVA